MDTPTPDPTEVTVRAYWRAAEERDWEAFAATLAADAVLDLPQTRERVQGREACTRFNREYPGDWHLAVTRLVGSGGRAVSQVKVTIGDESATGISFFELDEHGLVVLVEEWWPEPYDPPAGREHLVERY